ncbi:MAG: 50S ribosomal protein L25/general stress protein Ctc [Alistipes sp.]|jgi:large subunit ribosomal protein L25|nr:50S ribosomal protein L25/general stress protein Ctc [Alistipes sp.]
MQTLKLNAKKREEFGKKPTKAVRKEERIPAVVYGQGEPVNFSLDVAEVKPLIYTPASYIVELDIEGRKEVAVMREVQFHPVREEILHMDFFRVDAAHPVTIDIPVRITGNSEGVKMGGKLVQSKRKLTVSGLLANLPDELVVDITELGIGKTIFVGDLKYDNLRLLNPASTAVCAIRVTRAAAAAAAAASAEAKK